MLRLSEKLTSAGAVLWVGCAVAALGRRRPAAGAAAVAALALCAAVPLGRIAHYEGGPQWHARRAAALAEVAGGGDLVITFSTDADELAHALHKRDFAARMRSFPSWVDRQIAWIDTRADIAPEKAEALGAPILIHPTTPDPIPAGMDEWRLVPLIGFCADTSVAAAGMVFSGVMDAYPNLKIVLSHLGGTIAYLAERIERGWAIYPESRQHISRSPMEYFSQMWVDTVSFSTHALMCAYEFHGPERMMLGSDYPHQIGDLFKCVPAIGALPISEPEKRLIYETNAREVFRI